MISETETFLICKIYSFKVSSENASAEAMFSIIHEEALKKEFGKNLIGYVSNGAPVMNGNNNSVLSRLHNSYPTIWYLSSLLYILFLILYSGFC